MTDDEPRYDPMQDPDFLEWAHHQRAHVMPMIQKSAITVSLVPQSDTDIKFAVELGMSIMLDKPIIAVVVPGTQVPEKLRMIADAIVEGDMHSAEGSLALREAIERVMPGLVDD